MCEIGEIYSEFSRISLENSDNCSRLVNVYPVICHRWHLSEKFKQQRMQDCLNFQMVRLYVKVDAKLKRLNPLPLSSVFQYQVMDYFSNLLINKNHCSLQYIHSKTRVQRNWVMIMGECWSPEKMVNHIQLISLLPNVKRELDQKP